MVRRDQFGGHVLRGGVGLRTIVVLRYRQLIPTLSLLVFPSFLLPRAPLEKSLLFELAFLDSRVLVILVAFVHYC